MSDQETEQAAPESVILSDTTRKIVECVKVLDAIAKDKTASRQEQYAARDAGRTLRQMIGARVVGV